MMIEHYNRRQLRNVIFVIISNTYDVISTEILGKNINCFVFDFPIEVDDLNSQTDLINKHI